MRDTIHRHPVTITMCVLVVLFVAAPLVIATVIGFSSSPFLGGADVQTLPQVLFGYIRYQLNPMIGTVSALFVFRLVGFQKMIGTPEQ